MIEISTRGEDAVFTMKKEINAIDIDIETPFKPEGITYYRLTPDMKKFMQLCEDKHGIAGFQWDGSFNFGIILKNEKDEVHKMD